MKMLGLSQIVLAELEECSLHRIEWRAFTGEDRVFNQCVKFLWKLRFALVVDLMQLAVHQQRGNRHTI